MDTSSSDSPADRPLSQRLNTISHDLSNPLSVIMGNTQLLLELAKTVGSEADLQDPLKDIEKAAIRIEKQIALLNRVRDELIESEESNT